MKKTLLFLCLLFVASIVFSQSDDSSFSDQPGSSADENFYLSEPFPNPVKETAKIYFQLPAGEHKANLVIYNILGNEIKSYPVSEMDHSVSVTSFEFDRGSYFYRIEYKNFKSSTHRMVIQ